MASGRLAELRQIVLAELGFGYGKRRVPRFGPVQRIADAEHLNPSQLAPPSNLRSPPTTSRSFMARRGLAKRRRSSSSSVRPFGAARKSWPAPPATRRSIICSNVWRPTGNGCSRRASAREGRLAETHAGCLGRSAPEHAHRKGSSSQGRGLVSKGRPVHASQAVPEPSKTCGARPNNLRSNHGNWMQGN